jgi:hypothetical protein
MAVCREFQPGKDVTMTAEISSADATRPADRTSVVLRHYGSREETKFSKAPVLAWASGPLVVVVRAWTLVDWEFASRPGSGECTDAMRLAPVHGW